VWDGGTARQLGLVDRFGSLEDAIAEAARRANIAPDDARPYFLEREPNFFERVLLGIAEDDSSQGNDAYARLAERPDAMMARAMADVQALLHGPAIQARCLECPRTALVRAPRAAQAPSLLARLFAAVWG
jgi:protease-4